MLHFFYFFYILITFKSYDYMVRKMKFKNKRIDLLNIKNKVINNYLNISISLEKDNKVLITNYNKINSISNEEIIIDNILINGNNLIIETLDDYEIIIKGLLKEVIILE